MIIVDIETTGLDPTKNSIVSIGALDFSNPENQFYGECRPLDGTVIDKKALEINGFSAEDLNRKNKSCQELTEEFLNWAEKIEEKILAGENVWLDAGFLKKSAERIDRKWNFGHRLFDLHTLSYFHHLLQNKDLIKKKSNLSLDETLKYVGLPQEPRPHNALTGTKMEAEAFSRLIYKKNFLKEFKKYPLPNYLKIKSNQKK